MNDGISPIRTSVETDKIDAAMAAAQVDLENPIKGRTAKVEGTSKTSGKEYSIGYSYADIADILADCRPVIAGKGVAIYQVPVMRDGFMMIVTRLAHSGQWIEGDYPVCKIGGDHQDMGKAMTYARRYGLGAMIGIAPEKDTDGVGAAPAGASERPPTRDRSSAGLAVTAAKSAIIMCMAVEELTTWGNANADMIRSLPTPQALEIRNAYGIRLQALKADAADRARELAAEELRGDIPQADDPIDPNDPFDDKIPF